ncbi:oxidoreductase [Angustibacter sp. McL0619]|uniref:oxidoreductase n=1 Tax=Angustibacter sp. McL0619 TaxID=3415676 RepID=UPI003CEC10CB
MSSSRWTSSDIGDLSGQVAVVTGANSGVGFEASVELARHGAHVVLACRNAERGDEALRGLRARVSAASVELRQLDLADLASVRRFAAELLDARPRIDVLVNNAGVMAPSERALSADGHELQLATNHLGHFALTGLLLGGLGAARVVTVSSPAHRMGRIDFDDLDGEQSYKPWRAYGQSKLANLLFTMQLHRVAQAAGLDLVSVAAHPGWAATQLVSNGPAGAGWTGRLMTAGSAALGQPAAHGAWPLLFAATDPDVRATEFIGPGGWGGWRGHPVRLTAMAAAYDPDLAAALWLWSAEATGVHYDL